MCVLEVCKWIPGLFYLDCLDRVVLKVLINQIFREVFNQVSGGISVFHVAYLILNLLPIFE